MTFLNAGLLGGIIVAAGVPLVIHLLNKSFPKQFEFSSIVHIRQTAAQRSRIFRWRHRILLALRTALIALLLMAFLKPVLPRFGGLRATNTGRTVLLVFDHSLSMEHRGSGLSARQRAINEADSLLGTLKADDVCNIVLAGPSATTCFFDWSHNIAEARHFLSTLPPGNGGADISRANTAAARLLGQDPSAAEIYFFSDFQRKNWAGTDFTMLPPGARLFFVPALPESAASRDNHAVLSVAPSQSGTLAGDTLILEIEIGNFAAQPLQAPVRLTVDGQSGFERDVFVSPWSSTKIALPVPAGKPGAHLCEVSLPPDDLPDDDHRALTLNVAEKEGILIVTDAAKPDEGTPHFLKAALNPYENLAGSLLPKQIASAALDAGHFAAVRKTILAGVGALKEESTLQLAQFLFHGGGAIWFLDGEHDPANLAALEKAMGSPLPIRLGTKRVAKNVASGAQQFARGDFQSRFLRLFRDTQRQDLSLLEFYDIRDASVSGAGKVLLSFADGTPALAEATHGLGTLLLLDFSASELSSNLARQRAFPAWIHELMKNLSPNDSVSPAAIVGDTITGELWKAELSRAQYRKPDGTPLAPETEALGERSGISFAGEQPGFYTLRTDRLLRAWAVNPPADESDLRTLDSSQLPRQLGDSRESYSVTGRDDFSDAAQGRPIWHWFLLGALGVLLIELLFQVWVKRSATA